MSRLFASIAAAVLFAAGPANSGPASAAPADAGSTTAPTEETPQLGTVRGMDQFRTASGSRCTVAFTVEGGFLTAGRCVRSGDVVYALTGKRLGVVVASSYPRYDHAWVRLDAGWVPVGEVHGPRGPMPIHGAAEAPVGSSVCRPGLVTGWRCGTIVMRNATLTTPTGSHSGLVRTNVCVEPGDAGPYISNGQAQGITAVGGTGSCSSSSVSYFEPVAGALSAYGLRLLTTPR
ncbi:MAG TPA: S1 family peptidase [Pilimelia sp.]|nr:S1 family peptidase [Pilimelia sp.]